MHTDRSTLVFYVFAFLSIVLSVYTISVHIGFVFLPPFFLISGILISFLPEGRGLKIFFFLVPLINSLPAFFLNGYPFNLMGTLLFFLAGVIAGSIFKGEFPGFKEFKWAVPYLFFLLVLWISALFVILRWSNITLPAGGFFADTPVSPGHPFSQRISFAIIYPVITLFIFSIIPFTASLIKLYSLNRDEVFRLMVKGYFFSVLLAAFQKLVDNSFMSLSWWGEKLGQYNGGFSDFNGLGFFSGVVFLYSGLKLMSFKPDESKNKSQKERWFLIISLSVSFSGILLSGSRTAFIFVIFAFIFLMFSKVKNMIKIILPLSLIIVLLLSGSVLLKRLEKSFDSSKVRSNSIIDVVDKFSNGRVQMIKNSIPMVVKYPVSGVGSGNFFFYLNYLKYGKQFIKDLPLNQYLLFLDETGIIGLVFFLFFLVVVVRNKKNDVYLKIFYVFLMVMLVGNSLWLPELAVLFMILAASLNDHNKEAKTASINLRPALYLLLILFVSGNILSFNSLHPSRLMSDKGLPYDFGFWTESVDAGFRWTRGRAGVLLEIDKTGEYGPVRFFCGAPLSSITGNNQSLKLYRNGVLIDSKNFEVNENHTLSVNGKPGEKFFLGIEVSPVFNLKKLGQGEESRDLGVQYFSVSEEL